MDKLTHQEEEVMLLVWQMGEATIKQYHEKTQEPRVPYTTFASIITNLERKGYVANRKIGITKLCRPIISEEDYKRVYFSGAISNYFSNSYKEMVSFFAQEEKISTDELKEIIELIEKGKR